MAIFKNTNQAAIVSECKKNRKEVRSVFTLSKLLLDISMLRKKQTNQWKIQSWRANQLQETFKLMNQYKAT